MTDNEITISLPGVRLGGELIIPDNALGLIIFAHGSGSSRKSPRNHYVARILRQNGTGTLLFDLLTAQEELVDSQTGHLRFDIPFLAGRLLQATRWAQGHVSTRDLNLGYFGSSTGAAAALVAAAELQDEVSAVVSRGGRPDLAGDALEKVTAPTLLIVGGEDKVVIELNEEAYARLKCEKALRIVPGASHLFEEPGKLEIVAQMAAELFVHHLQPVARHGSS
jgi:putative phosphoribosyl transferase